MSASPPAIPDTKSKFFLGRVKEAVEVMLGRRGTQRNKVVTYQDLIDMEIIDENYEKI